MHGQSFRFAVKTWGVDGDSFPGNSTFLGGRIAVHVVALNIARVFVPALLFKAFPFFL
jgi:hypothetical protein